MADAIRIPHHLNVTIERRDDLAGAGRGWTGPGLVLLDWDDTVDGVWPFSRMTEAEAWGHARRRQTVRRGVVKAMATRRRNKAAAQGLPVSFQSIRRSPRTL